LPGNGRVQALARVVPVDEQPGPVDHQALRSVIVQAERSRQLEAVVAGEARQSFGRRWLDLHVEVKRAGGADHPERVTVHPDLERRLPDRQSQVRLRVGRLWGANTRSRL
jgi:hypothetical protein